MINCKNCGAPLSGVRCEYCGTIYKKNTHMEFWIYGKPVHKEKLEESLCDPRGIWVEVDGGAKLNG